MRCLTRRFDDDRATSCKRRSYLSCYHRSWKVPSIAMVNSRIMRLLITKTWGENLRSDDSTDSYWLLDSENRCAWCLRWNCIAIRATGFLWEPQDEARCIDDLPFGFIVRLAILKAQNCRHFPISGWSLEDNNAAMNLQSLTLAMMRSYHFRSRTPRCAPVVDL